MVPPISLIMPNLSMERFETKVLSTSSKPPNLWLRYVSDIFMVQKTSYENEFLMHINSIEPDTQFTVTGSDGSMPFLDTLGMPLCHNLMVPYQLQYTESPHTLIYIFSGIEAI